MTTQHRTGTRPAVRRYARRTYQLSAVACLVAAVQAVILAVVGAAFWPALTAAALLLGGAVTLVAKSIPFDDVRFPSEAG